MATLVFRVSSDWEQVVRLREEIKKLETQLRNFGKSTPEQEVRKLETQLASTKQQMMGLVTEAAKAGATMENDFKKKIYDASQVVNDFSTKITMQRGTIRQLQNELTTLKERYREVVKSNGDTSGMPEQIKALSLRLREQKDALFNLTQQQATARLSVKKLRDEYALFKQDGGDVKMTVDGISSSMRNWAATIAGGMGIKEFLGKIIQVRGEFENIETSLRVLLGGDTERLGSLLKEMKEYALISPLTTKDMASAMQMMIGFGIQAEDAMTYLKALGDISMGNTVHFNSLALAFSQMSAAGKLMGQDLNQMINAGFNPLQQISEKTGKSIGELKDEMSKGAISAQMVQQAFIDATSEGGKFYGMATEGAKTINGQISMLQESMDNMFNDMGQASQGAIVSAIQLTTKLVENYESVGKVLISMVAAYGTYKAALIANTALELARNKTLLTTIKNTRLAIAVQNVFNNVVKKHPFALIASLAIGAATAIYNFTKRTDKATEASAKLAANIKTETNELDDLFDRLKKAKEGTDERRTAIEDINSKYGSYLSNLLTEKSTVEDISEAYQEAKKSIIDYNVEKARTEYLQEPLERVTEYTESFYKTASKFSEELTNESQKGRFQAYLDKMVDDLKNGKTFNVDQIYDAFRAAQAKGNYSTVDDWLKAYRSGLENYGISDTEIISKVGGLDISDFKYSAGQLGIAFQSLSKASEEFKSFSKAYTETFDNSTKTEGPKKDLQTLGQLVDAIKKAEDNLKSLRSQSQQGLIETDKVKEAEEELAALTAKYKLMTDEQYGGTSQKQKKNDEKKEKERLKAEQRLGEELAELQRKNQESETALMREGTEKKLKQIDDDYDARKAEIEQKEREFNELNKKSKVSATNANGLTEEQQSAINKANRFNDEKRAKDIIKVYAAEAEAMRENLKEYGTLQQQKLAITQEYAEKIAKATTEYERQRLSVERNGKLANIEMEELSSKIDWSTVFGGFGSMFEDIVRPALDDARRYMKTDEFRNSDQASQQALVEAVNSMERNLGDGGKISFKKLGNEVTQLQNALLQLRKAEAQYAEDFSELIEAQNNYAKAMASGTDDEKEAAKARLDNAQAEATASAEHVQSMQETADGWKNIVTDTASNMRISMDGVVKGLQQLTSGSLSGVYNGLVTLGDAAKEQGGKLGKAFGKVSETLKDVPIIGWIVSIIDVFKDGLSDVVGGIVDAVFNAINGIIGDVFNFGSEGLWMTLTNSIGNGLQGLFDALTFGGFSKWFGFGGNEEEVKDTIDRLTRQNESLQSAIEDLTDTIEASRGKDSVDAYEQAKQMQQQVNQNALAAAQAQASYTDAHHSWNYYWKGFAPEAVARFSSQIGRDWNGDIFNLSPEEMKILRDFNSDMWEVIRTSGKGGYGDMLIEKLNAYIDQAGKLEEIENQIAASMTGITFESMYDSFVDTLMDMDASAEDFADDFSEYMMRALLSNKIGELMYDDLEAWYGKFAQLVMKKNKGEISEDEFNTGMEALQNEWGKLVDRGLAMRDELAAATGYDETAARKQQTASRGGFETMSQDQASELSGRFTAVAETGIRIEGAITELRGDLSGLLAQSQGLYNIADDTRNILAESYLELQQINENTAAIVVPIQKMQKDIEQVKQNTSRL